nr:hypothetical protein [Tanacetum cinerariifolium]
MLNKKNYVPWSSRLLRYAKSRPNGKLIHNSIINGPHARRMIPEPGDPDREVSVNETFHVQIDDELTEKELKQIEADDQAIQTILLGLPKDIYAAVDSCETTQEIWQIAQRGMNMGQDRQMQMVEGNGENQFRQYAGQNIRNLNGYNAVQNIRNQNLNRNGNHVAARTEGNAIGHNGNQIRCYNCRGVADLDEIEEVNANCILMANLQQASTSDISKTANVSKSISIPNEEFSDETTPSVARKFLNEVKSTIMTLQRVVKHRMTLETHNWSSFTHQELHKIVKDEIFPIVNQVDARVQNFEIQFLKEAAKFDGDFKSLAKEADESLAKQNALELEIERLLKAIVSQDIMSVVQNNSVVDTSNLQTELERTKERFKNCIIKKENEYAKLWNDWYKMCEECKFDNISYDKAYNDMQQKIERLQAQLGDLKGKSKDTSCVSDTLNSLSQKLENENVELEFQVLKLC